MTVGATQKMIVLKQIMQDFVMFILSVIFQSVMK